MSFLADLTLSVACQTGGPLSTVESLAAEVLETFGDVTNVRIRTAGAVE